MEMRLDQKDTSHDWYTVPGTVPYRQYSTRVSCVLPVQSCVVRVLQKSLLRRERKLFTSPKIENAIAFVRLYPYDILPLVVNQYNGI